MDINTQKEPVSILIVEDSKTQAEILRDLLYTAGYTVQVAFNGRQTLEKIIKNHPAMVLTNVMMSEMNGYELCKILKAGPVTRNIPVILVNQLFDPLDVLSGLECGADNFIVKPYESAYLLDRIKEILANKLYEPDECEGESVLQFVDNALRHGEHVTTIQISTSEKEDVLELSISDDGAGVTDEDKEKIFGRRYGKNTSFGLFLVREI